MHLHVYNLQYFTINLFILFSTNIYLSAGNNAYYTICKNNPFYCGNITNLGYPFWVGNRPQFCGHRNFGLSCQNGPIGVPFIYRMGKTSGAESLSARVVSINTSSHTMSLVQNPFCYNITAISCQSLIRNETITKLSKPFKFSPLVANISLFLSCGASVANYSASMKFLTCNGVNTTSDSAYYVDKAEDVGNVSKLCPTRRVFPVLRSELGDLNNGNASLTRVLNKGFEVEYTADFDVCISCQNSGGVCGSSDDYRMRFSCYCPDGTSTAVCHKPGKKTLKYIGSGIGGGIFVFVAVLAIWYRRCLKFGKTRNKSLDRSESDLGKDGLYFGVPLFSYKELDETTNNFDHTRELGGGGFGTVYYGKLKDGREVAVKRLYERGFKRVEQFMNEVQILTCLRHQNLVSLYGCTSSHSRELLLVYEYVSNGTVADHLFGHKANSGPLSWDIRLKIAVETAAALSYLHASDIIHRDVKTNNILLDKNFNVKVADFGLSRLFPNDVTHVSTAPQGTPGYLDPEYHQCYKLTDKSDVYSFGVVLVELLSSLRAVDMDRHNYEINLSNYAMNRIQRCSFADLVDPQLGFESDFKVRRMTTSVAELAFQCLQHYKDFRPSMDEVLEVLMRIQSFDYEALQIEEMEKKDLVQTSNLLSPSPTEDYGVKLMSNHQLNRQSPTSVMINIVSSSTISENPSN